MKTIKIENDVLKVHVGSRKYINPKEMLVLESDINYTIISLNNGQKILSSTTLKIIESRLMSFSNFVRVNRQVVVNLDFIEEESENGFLLSNNRLLVFSRRRAKSWREKI
jgi:DNA-binding LytR/AlgR family response regulator